MRLDKRGRRRGYWTAAICAQFREMWSAGVHASQMSTTFAITERDVYARAYKLGLPPRRKPKKTAYKARKLHPMASFVGLPAFETKDLTMAQQLLVREGAEQLVRSYARRFECDPGSIIAHVVQSLRSCQKL